MGELTQEEQPVLYTLLQEYRLLQGFQSGS